MALSVDNFELVIFLIYKSADANANLRGELNISPECAALLRSMSLVKALVNAGTQIKGRFALQLAAHKGKTEVISYLFDCGAPIDENPDTDLVISGAPSEAALKGHLEAVKLVLEKDVDVDVKDMYNKTAPKFAKIHNHIDCVDIFREV